MEKYKTTTSVFFALVAVSLAVSVAMPQVLAYHEYPEIDMQYTVNPTIGNPVTIDCIKDDSTELNMLMTVFRYHDRIVLASIANSTLVVSHTLIPQDTSMIQIFCEYIDEKEDKVGYAVMRTFTPNFT